MKIQAVFGIIFALSMQVSHAQVDNPHSAEAIATVREVYDGTFLPDIGANTFRNIDRLFSTRMSILYPLEKISSLILVSSLTDVVTISMTT